MLRLRLGREELFVRLLVHFELAKEGHYVRDAPEKLAFVVVFQRFYRVAGENVLSEVAVRVLLGLAEGVAGESGRFGADRALFSSFALRADGIAGGGVDYLELVGLFEVDDAGV